MKQMLLLLHLSNYFLVARNGLSKNVCGIGSAGHGSSSLPRKRDLLRDRLAALRKSLSCYHIRCYHNGVITPPNTARAASLKTVFLDRDGVVNTKMPEGHWVTCWSEFHVLPGVIEAIAALKRARLRVIVVSNQRGIALGRFTGDDVQAIHNQFQQMLTASGTSVDGFYFCPHDRAQCNCRKPLPGLFEQARADHPGIRAETSVIIGDSKSDMEFGRRLGMMTVFIEGDPARQKPGVEAGRALADMQAGALFDAAQRLLAMRRALGEQPSTMCLGFPGK
jgi:D-glycero-D-manno-heptose 1,7-bisphosphate phosphatase